MNIKGLYMLNTPEHTEEKPHEEIRRYIKETKGVDISSNINWDKIILWFLIRLVIDVGVIGIWKWYEKYQRHQKADEEIIDT